MRKTFSGCLAQTLALIALLASCQRAPSCGTQIRNGLIDLSGHDFFSDGTVSLSGDWHYVPGRLLTPAEIDNPAPGIQAELIAVPGFWTARADPSPRKDGLGSGTCWLDVRLPPDCPDLILATNQIHSSYRLFLNGKPLGGPLITDPGAERLVASNKPGYFRVRGGTDTLRIVLNVTNYWDHTGTGLPRVPRLGLAEALEREHTVNAAYESFIAGFLFLSVLYHLMLYVIQRRDRALLLFSLISLTAFVRQLATSEYFWLALAGFRMYAVIRIEVATVFIICLLFNLYFRIVYPGQCPRTPYIASVVEGAALAAITVFSPAKVFSWLLVPLYIYGLQTAIQALYTIGRAMRERVPLSGVMFAGTAVYALPCALDILSANLSLNIRYLMPLGLLPFIMAQTYVLAKRYTKAAEEAENLRVTTARLTKLDEAKTNFLANISHELRTPLTLIRAPVEAIREGEYGTEIPNTHPVFGLIRGNVDRLLRLIENFLNITRLESAQPYDLEPVDVRRLLPVYLDEFSAIAGERGIALAIDAANAPCVAEIDHKAFETILFNLLSNALKFTGRGGRVSVRVGILEEDGKRLVCIDVADTGCGIPETEIPHLFVRYRRIYDRERHQYEGNGLGLSIARETARALGGDLSVTSVAGKGSTFRLVMPESARAAVTEGGMARDQMQGAGTRSAGTELDGTEPGPMPMGERARTADTAGTASLSARRVMVVEDHAEMRAFIRDALAPEYAIAEAGDGEAALGLLDEGRVPDLVLCDIMMPKMDGPTLLAKLREDPKYAAIPFIFLTARDEPAEKVELLQNGSLDYIVKPFSIGELRARIRAVLDQRDRERYEMRRKVETALIFGEAPDREPELTSREEEVLGLVADGATDKEIAERLGISARTASNHVAAILRKTGLSSRQSLRQRFGK